jgi:hypothetical protein
MAKGCGPARPSFSIQVWTISAFECAAITPEVIGVTSRFYSLTHIPKISNAKKGRTDGASFCNRLITATIPIQLVMRTDSNSSAIWKSLIDTYSLLWI